MILKKANEALVTLTDEFAESRRNVKELETPNPPKDGTKRDFGEELQLRIRICSGEINKGSTKFSPDVLNY